MIKLPKAYEDLAAETNEEYASKGKDENGNEIFIWLEDGNYHIKRFGYKTEENNAYEIYNQ